MSPGFLWKSIFKALLDNLEFGLITIQIAIALQAFSEKSRNYLRTDSLRSQAVLVFSVQLVMIFQLDEPISKFSVSTNFARAL